MRDYQDALRLARREAEKRYPEGEYTVQTLIWCDGDFRVMVRHGMGQAGGEEVNNALAERIVVTPFQKKIQLIEVTDSERYTVHKEEDI
ncbi:hypothetical protein HVTV-2_gp42 [Haloarcula virus HVTV-2]|uniref:Uncharacterized protein n=1 Tax=Haloarcula vallismortis tailed virus 1 TaxID=1262528 RepID=L7TNI1_9CAUD|nr:hypothetical protein HVTV1_42 [Haloarcula vallismortis tailed virus 1]AGC34412.1 hypothetical protein HVTV1_42 [Haloarcula vallismortis tailed virus 1]UBF22849.1 hypothetical protein HVTV-2_gp42 [Haloarcula virus HVTV-2]